MKLVPILGLIFAVRLSGQLIATSFSFGGSGSTAYQDVSTQLYFNDTPQSIAIDNSGNTIVAGTAYSLDFPQINGLTSVGQFPPCNNGLACAFRAPFVAKVDATGSFLVYATLLGAPSSYQGREANSLVPIAAAVDSAGNAYVTGTTAHPNFPHLTGGDLSYYGGNDAYLIKLDPNGDIIFSTLFGGSGDDAGTGIVLGSNGAVYITGTTASPNFPVTAGAYRTALSSTRDIFLAALDPATGRILSSTYLRQGNNPRIALAPDGQVYVSTGTDSSEIVLLRIDPIASKVSLSTTIEGTPASFIDLTAGPDGSLYLAGITDVSNLPTTPGVLGPAMGVPSTYNNPFITHLDSNGVPLYLTYLKGFANRQIKTLAISASGNAFFGGSTYVPGMPVIQAVQQNLVASECVQRRPDGAFGFTYACASGGFVGAINASATNLDWSTYLGAAGSSVLALASDAKSNLYVAGNSIALSGPYVGKTISIVKFFPKPPVLTLAPQSVANAASFIAGLPARRGLATAFVGGLSGIPATIASPSYPLPTELAGVSVRVNGTQAPMLSIARTDGGHQVTFQVPSMGYIFGNLVEIRQNGNSAFLGATAAPAGIFQLPDGTPAIQRALDYSLVTPSNPAMPGETIIIYATGITDTNPGPPDGIPFTGPLQSSYAVYVNVGNLLSSAADYAGPSPGYVGLYQIQYKIPEQLVGPQSLSISSGVSNPILGITNISNSVKLYIR